MEGKNGRRRGPAHLSARGMVLLLLIAVVVALACGPAADGAQAAVKRCKGAAKPLKVAVYVGGGTNSDKVCATMRALQACGFDFAGVQRDDIVQGRLVRDSYDVLLLPAGQDDSKVVYDVYWGLGGDPIARDNIRSFVSGGGGVVGLESGAAYMCQDGALQLYSGLYTRTGEAGKTWLGVTDPAFGCTLQQVYRTAGGGHFSVPAGCRTVARSLQGRTVIARSAYGSGRVVVCSVDPELRGDSTLDWCIWDNWEMRGCHVNSAGAWELLGRMVHYAGSGVARRPQPKRLRNPSGKRLAQLGREDLHVTRQHDQLDVLLVDRREHPRLGAYAEALAKRPTAVNSFAFCGHMSLRVEAMDYDVYRPATDAEIGRMQDRLRESLREGAGGFSTGLYYAPNAQAPTAEVIAVGPNVRAMALGDHVLFNPEDRYEVEVRGADYIILRERDVHAVASKRLEEGSTGLYL